LKRAWLFIFRRCGQWNNGLSFECQNRRARVPIHLHALHTPKQQTLSSRFVPHERLLFARMTKSLCCDAEFACPDPSSNRRNAAKPTLQPIANLGLWRICRTNRIRPRPMIPTRNTTATDHVCKSRAALLLNTESK